MAVMGSVPERICPVIIPGNEIMPMPTMLLSVGKSAVSIAWLANGVRIFGGVTPMLINESIFILCEWIFSLKVFTPRLTPVSALPIIIPLIGIVYCGLKILTPTITIIKKHRMLIPDAASDAPTINLNFLLIDLFRCRVM